MRDTDKYMWVPILAFCIGIGLPGILFNFKEDSWQEKIWGGMLTSMACFSYAIFKNIGIKYPRLKNWGTNTLAGATITIFFSSFIVSLLSAFFAILPLPVWFHFSCGFALAFSAAVLLSRDLY